jgi:aminoglycoside/choline kinase family phosphotransferase
MSGDGERILALALDGLEGTGDGAVTVTALAADASTRTYYRVVPRQGPTCILMRMAADPLKSDEVVDGERPRRMPFLDVAAYLEAGGIPVPAVLGVDLSRSAILLEDLGDQTLERALASGGDKAALYRRAVELLADVQAWATAHPDPECVAFRRHFGEGLLRWELAHFEEWLLVAWAGARPTPGERATLDAFYDGLTSAVAGLPRGFVHRDFQSRNLMVQGERLRLIDFQDALEGPYLYDLVALLRDSYVAFTPDEVEAIARHYLAARQARGLWVPSFDALMRGFHLQALQRKLKDAGRFVYIDRVRGNPKFLPNIPRSLGYAREALERLDGMDAVREIVARYLPEHFG